MKKFIYDYFIPALIGIFIALCFLLALSKPTNATPSIVSATVVDARH